MRFDVSISKLKLEFKQLQFEYKKTARKIFRFLRKRMKDYLDHPLQH